MANLGGGSHPGCAVLTGHAFRGSSIPFASLKRRRPIDTVLPAERASNGCGLTALSHAIGKVPGVGDDGAQVGVLRGPTQAVAEFPAAGHQTGGVAFAARADHIGNFPAGDFLHRADHLHHAAACAGADVELIARAAVQQVLDGLRLAGDRATADLHRYASPPSKHTVPAAPPTRSPPPASRPEGIPPRASTSR